MLSDFPLDQQWLKELQDERMFDEINNALKDMYVPIQYIPEDDSIGEIFDPVHYHIMRYEGRSIAYIRNPGRDNYMISILDHTSVKGYRCWVSFYGKEIADVDSWIFGSSTLEITEDKPNMLYAINIPIKDVKWFCVFFRLDQQTKRVCLHRQNCELLCDRIYELGLSERFTKNLVENFFEQINKL